MVALSDFIEANRNNIQQQSRLSVEVARRVFTTKDAKITKFGVEIIENLRAVRGERNDPKFAEGLTIR